MRSIGEIFTNNDGFDAKIMGIDHRTKYGNYYYRVQFLESGFETVVDGSNLSKGVFKDYGRPTVYGVGYSYPKANAVGRVYKTWAHMLERCYCNTFHAYPRYGGAGVKVSNDWLHFEKFEKDIRSLPNYEKFVNCGRYSLDKDILGSGKLYSRETCMFASDYEQSHAQKRVKTIIAVDESGREIKFPSVHLCSNILKIPNANIYKVLRGERKLASGFYFKRETA